MNQESIEDGDQDGSESYEEALQRLEKLKGSKLRKLYEALVTHREEIMALLAEADRVAGSPEAAHRELLLLEARKAGSKGFLLGDARFLIRDPNHLAVARKSLVKPKDAKGNPLPPLMREERTDGNELRLFIVSSEHP